MADKLSGGVYVPELAQAGNGAHMRGLPQAVEKPLLSRLEETLDNNDMALDRFSSLLTELESKLSSPPTTGVAGGCSNPPKPVVTLTRIADNAHDQSIVLVNHLNHLSSIICRL